MKPVNLAPGDVAVAAAGDGKPNYGMIGGAVAGVLMIAFVAGYFAMARVDTVKSEMASLNARAAEVTQETEAVQQQVASLGQPVIDSDKQLAQGQEQIVVSAYTERHDFVQLADELRGIMRGTGGWYEEVTASSATANGEGRAIKIKGVMPTKELAASFNERVNATRTMRNSSYDSLESVRLLDIKSKRRGTYWKFEISADMVDTEAPFAAGSGGDATGTTVADGPDATAIKLSLEPKPRPRAAAPAAPAEPPKPRNPFDVAASAAREGGA
jgi:outer membrane murein-binding lipoprotein Lpp